jgi:hypothetical protein
MKESDLDAIELRRIGFTGFVSVESLQGSRTDVPSDPGVYVVVAPDRYTPSFVEQSVGGRFKGKDPTVGKATLQARWADGATLLYIGKAGRGASGRRGLRTRIGELVAFGAGRPVGHWGGRYLWQLAESGSLLVAWRTDDHPTVSENELLDTFEHNHGRYPFANILGPRR